MKKISKIIYRGLSTITKKIRNSANIHVLKVHYGNHRNCIKVIPFFSNKLEIIFNVLFLMKAWLHTYIVFCLNFDLTSLESNFNVCINT